MCSIANLFDTNVRKDDSKNIFSPRILRLCKSLGKINFLKNKISVTMLIVRTILMHCCIKHKGLLLVLSYQGSTNVDLSYHHVK